MKARRADLLAMGFLIAALVLLVLSPVMVQERWEDPFDESGWGERRGYEVWEMVFDSYRIGYIGHLFTFVVAASVLSAGVTLVSPFLLGVLTRSRPLWWLVVGCSATALAGTVVGMVWWAYATSELPEEVEFGMSHYFGVAVPFVNFAGLLFVRGVVRESEPASRNPDC